MDFAGRAGVWTPHAKLGPTEPGTSPLGSRKAWVLLIRVLRCNRALGDSMWDLYRNLNKLHMGNKIEGNPYIGKLLEVIENKRNWYQANCKSAKADCVLFGYCFRSLGRASGDRGLGTPRVGVWGRGSQPNAEGLRLRRGMRGARLKVSLNRDRSLWAATRATCLTSHVEATTHTPLGQAS